jgi:hypothetical protein
MASLSLSAKFTKLFGPTEVPPNNVKRNNCVNPNNVYPKRDFLAERRIAPFIDAIMTSALCPMLSITWTGPIL